MSKLKIPKTLGACADLYGNLREQRLALQRQADAVEAQEKELREHIIKTLPKADNVTGGKKWMVERSDKQVPTVKDWDKLYGYISKNDRFDLLHRRVNEKAVTDMWDDKKTVPGVEPFTVVTLSLPRKV